MATPGVFDDDFLLDTALARALYHRFAEPEPILDFHSYLSPAEIARDHRFRSVTELWLARDDYKWRAMRANGIPERLCTGDAPDFLKFEAWARTVPKTLGNPLFHWTHLELKRVFGIRYHLDERSARETFEAMNATLAAPDHGACGLVEAARVVALCTTDDPADSLEHHLAHARSPAKNRVRLYPTFRPDAALGVEDPEVFRHWLARLEAAVGAPIRRYDELLAALDSRHAYFHAAGCRLSDHSLDRVPSAEFSLSEAREAFALAIAGTPVTGMFADIYQSALLHELAELDHARGWTQQFHVGALRDTSTRLHAALGADAGGDSIGDFEQAGSLSSFLDRLDRSNELARTILYNANPRDTELFATMIGNFQDGSVPGKLQLGSAWWFSNHRTGIERQLDALSQVGLLSRFVGTVTDAKSFLSYSRHEYFRRVLCGLLGRDAERGLLPHDEKWLGEMVQDISFRNARDYLGLELPEIPR